LSLRQKLSRLITKHLQIPHIITNKIKVVPMFRVLQGQLRFVNYRITVPTSTFYCSRHHKQHIGEMHCVMYYGDRGAVLQWHCERAGDRDDADELKHENCRTLYRVSFWQPQVWENVQAIVNDSSVTQFPAGSVADLEKRTDTPELRPETEVLRESYLTAHHMTPLCEEWSTLFHALAEYMLPAERSWQFVQFQIVEYIRTHRMHETAHMSVAQLLLYVDAANELCVGDDTMTHAAACYWRRPVCVVGAQVTLFGTDADAPPQVLDHVPRDLPGCIYLTRNHRAHYQAITAPDGIVEAMVVPVGAPVVSAPATSEYHRYIDPGYGSDYDYDFCSSDSDSVPEPEPAAAKGAERAEAE